MAFRGRACLKDAISEAACCQAHQLTFVRATVRTRTYERSYNIAFFASPCEVCHRRCGVVVFLRGKCEIRLLYASVFRAPKNEREKKKEDPITHTRAQKDTRCLRIVVGVIILRSYPSAGSKGPVGGGDFRHFPARGESLIGA